jgi:hypothetical protein
MEASFLPQIAYSPLLPAIKKNADASMIQPPSATPAAHKPPSSFRKRGAGIAFLHSHLASDSTGLLSKSAKQILSNLLVDNNVHLENQETPPPPPPVMKKPRKPIESNMSDERIMQLAQEGELSFLASLLRMMEEETGAVTTKFLIKACCLSVEPSKVPAMCDGKEMVMAALHFLSQTHTLESTGIFPNIPLIRTVQPVQEGTTPLEKRAYVKSGSWVLADILPSVLALEEIFYESQDYAWMAREHAMPNLKAGRDMLLLKGSAPAYATGKPKKVVGPRRKKSTTNGHTDEQLRSGDNPRDDPTASSSSNLVGGKEDESTPDERKTPAEALPSHAAATTPPESPTDMVTSDHSTRTAQDDEDESVEELA